MFIRVLGKALLVLRDLPLQPSLPCYCIAGDEDSISSGRFSDHKTRAAAMKQVCLFLLPLKRPGNMHLSHLKSIHRLG